MAVPAAVKARLGLLLREGTLIQVLDPATPPERKSKPKRALTSAGTAIAVALVLVAWVVLRRPRPVASGPATASGPTPAY